MINKDLYIFLRDTTPNMETFSKTFFREITPGTDATRFLNEGYAMEYYTVKGGAPKVSWFWGRGELIIPTSPYSSVVLLTVCNISTIRYGPLINGLREFAESRKIYQKLRDEHSRRIAERINDMRTLSPLENYIKLLETKPWVFEHASNENIASYLNISTGEFDKIRRSQA